MKYFIGKEERPSQQMLTFVLAFIICAIIGTIISMLLSPFCGGNSNALLAINALAQVIMFAIPPIWVAFRFYQEPHQFLQLQHNRQTGRYLLWSLLLIVVVVPFNECITAWNDSWHWSGGWSQVEKILRQMGEESSKLLAGSLENTSIGQLIFNLFAIALVPAVCEELFFRGGLQQLLYRWTHRPHLAIVLTAIIFSLAHMDLFAFLPRVLLGILLGYMFYYSGSIWVSMSAHFLNNAAVVVLYFLYHKHIANINIAEEITFAWYAVIASAIVTAIIFYIAFLRKPKQLEGTESW